MDTSGGRRRVGAAATYLGFGLERLKAAHLECIAVELLDIKRQLREETNGICMRERMRE
jgi:hypothetical protein